jgi:hypothetical protein
LINISASTKDLGVMWGSMLQSGIEMQIIVEDRVKDSEIFKDNLQGIKGFQTSKEEVGGRPKKNDAELSDSGESTRSTGNNIPRGKGKI